MLYFSTFFAVLAGINVSTMGFNAVDALMGVVMAAVIYFGRKDEIISGFVKLFGVACTVFIAVHFYVRLADFLRVSFLGKDAQAEFLAFCLLFIPSSLVFSAISRWWAIIVQARPPIILARLGNVALSLVRGYFVCGLVFIALLLINHDFAAPKARQSVSGVIFRNAASRLYAGIYAELIQNFFPEEKINEAIFELLKEKPGKGGKV